MFRVKVLLVLVTFLCATEIFAQQQINNGRDQNENVNQLTKSVFKYPKFIEGEIILKDSTKINKKLNYNRVLGKILFEDRIGQSRDLENPDLIDKIIIGKDTFCIRNNMYLEKLSHCSNVNLYANQTISYLDREKSNISGIPVIVSTDGSKVAYTNDESKQEKGFDRNSFFLLSTGYYLLDSSGVAYPAGKKIFYDLFPSLKNELKGYLHDHSVNFSNAADLENLLQYLDGH
jgi:hypothetical protein